MSKGTVCLIARRLRFYEGIFGSQNGKKNTFADARNVRNSRLYSLDCAEERDVCLIMAKSTEYQAGIRTCVAASKSSLLPEHHFQTVADIRICQRLGSSSVKRTPQAKQNPHR